MDDISRPLTFVLFLFLYFLPLIVAKAREHKNIPSIFVLNFFLGWTLIGWVIALIWAVKKDGTERSTPKNTWTWRDL